MKRLLFLIGLALSCSIVYGQEATICSCTQTPIWFSFASGFASLFALIFIAFYFFKPKFSITDDTNDEEFRIKCTNVNCFPTPIKDIKCDIVLAKDNKYKTVKTLKLRKDWIPGIKHNDNYVFISKKEPDLIKDKKIMKVRILAVNIIGVRKYYEYEFTIS